MSRNQGFVPLFGGGQGNLCLGLPIVRFDRDVIATTTVGTASFALDFTGLPQQTVFQAGETWSFQLWFRDANPGPTSNTTPGLAVTLR
ncbi:MAG: hypothetical protein GY711_24955 [bacterium]|nr:hypothetical protein [bacterium]